MIFSSPTFTNLERGIKRGHNSIHNHLLSLHQDSEYVDQIKDIFPTFNLIANLRNGLWYHRYFDAHCYFKSTDGHEGFESFSTIRLNLNVAENIALSSGGIIVDSTKRGKSYPDSFKTVIPVWVAVINSIVFNDGQDFETFFHPPPIMSSAQAKTICQKMKQMMSSVEFQPFCSLIAERLTPILRKPLRTFFCSVSGDGSLDWLSEDIEEVLDAQFTATTSSSSSISTTSAPHSSEQDRKQGGNVTRIESDLPYHPVVLFSCSTCLSEAERLARREFHSWTYVQGAGDDTENWGEGLTPQLFWSHLDELLPLSDPVDLSRFIAQIVGEAKLRVAECAVRLSTETNQSVASALNIAENVIQISGTKILFVAPDVVETRCLSNQQNTSQIQELVSSVSSKYSLSGIVLVSSPSTSSSQALSESATTTEDGHGSDHTATDHVLSGSDPVRVLNLTISSEKKDRALMHNRWSSGVFPSLLTFARTIIAESDHTTSDSYLLLCCRDWSVATVLLAALLLQLYPQLILTNDVPYNSSDELSNTEPADPADSIGMKRHWTKNDIKYTLSILQQSHMSLQCSRMLMKELSAYFV